MGGDEFITIFEGEDFDNREALVEKFNEAQEEVNASTENKWDTVSIALGIAVYDPAVDSSVDDTARRADKIMYENKRQGKKAQSAF